MKTEFRIGRETVTVRENLVDRIVHYIDPVKGQRRFQARAVAAHS